MSPNKVKVRRPQRKAESRVSKVMLFADKLSEPRSEYDSAELAFELAFGSDSDENERRLSKNSQGSLQTEE